MSDPAGQQQRLAAIEGFARRWREGVAGDRPDGRVASTQDAARRLEASGAGKSAMDALRAKAGEVVADEASLLAARSATAAAAALASRLANWVGLGAIGLASAVGLLLLHAGIARPIAGMTAMMGRLAQGDVGLTVPGAGRRDEVGAMAAAVGVFTLGTIPLSNTIAKGNLVVFAGRRWLVEDINEQAQVLQVSAHQGGVIPKFDRLSVEPAHDRLVAEMRLVYVAADIPPYLDTQAAAFLAEGRAAHRRLGLGTTTVLDTGRDVHLFLWRGDTACSVFAAALALVGLPPERHDLGVTVRRTNRAMVRKGLERISAFRPADLKKFSEQVTCVQAGKFDLCVPEPLFRPFWARRHAELLPDLALTAVSLLN